MEPTRVVDAVQAGAGSSADGDLARIAKVTGICGIILFVKNTCIGRLVYFDLAAHNVVKIVLVVDAVARNARPRADGDLGRIGKGGVIDRNPALGGAVNPDITTHVVVERTSDEYPAFARAGCGADDDLGGIGKSAVNGANPGNSGSVNVDFPGGMVKIGVIHNAIFPNAVNCTDG